MWTSSLSETHTHTHTHTHTKNGLKRLYIYTVYIYIRNNCISLLYNILHIFKLFQYLNFIDLHCSYFREYLVFHIALLLTPSFFAMAIQFEETNCHIILSSDVKHNLRKNLNISNSIEFQPFSSVVNKNGKKSDFFSPPKSVRVARCIFCRSVCYDVWPLSGHQGTAQYVYLSGWAGQQV